MIGDLQSFVLWFTDNAGKALLLDALFTLLVVGAFWLFVGKGGSGGDK